MKRARSTLAPLVALVLGIAGSLGASPAPRDTVDPTAVLRRVQEAQARFERVRRDHLPWAVAAPAGECDERIGRFCYWHETGGDDRWVPPPEPPPVIAARETLIDALAEAAGRLPESDWIVGQRVRYLVEAGRSDEALAVARSCRAAGWWCDALEGFVHHATGRFVEAEEAFDEALGGMGSVRRDEWTDLGPILDRDARSAWRDLGPGGRRAFARRFWWMADPLWIVPGNERLAEHHARRVLDRMQDDARSGFDVTWGDDLREITLRYGWPAGWERVRPRAAGLAVTSYSVVGHDPDGARRFAPPLPTVLTPSVQPPGDWFQVERPTSTFAVPYAPTFEALPHQLALFRRDGAARIVAAWDAPVESPPDEVVVEAGLVVAADPDAEPATTTLRSSAGTGSLDLVVPWSPAVVSVEAVAPEGGWAARSRYGLPLPGPVGTRPAVSDLLVIDAASGLPATLDAAVERARGSLDVAPGETIGLFWEIYPPGGGPYDAEVSIALLDERGGFWDGLKAAVGLGREVADGVALSWTEAIGGSDRHARSVAITLPADLPPGEYALRLEVRLPDSRLVRARRAVRVDGG